MGHIQVSSNHRLDPALSTQERESHPETAEPNEPLWNGMIIFWGVFAITLAAILASYQIAG